MFRSKLRRLVRLVAGEFSVPTPAWLAILAVVGICMHVDRTYRRIENLEHAAAKATQAEPTVPTPTPVPAPATSVPVFARGAELAVSPADDRPAEVQRAAARINEVLGRAAEAVVLGLRPPTAAERAQNAATLRARTVFWSLAGVPRSGWSLGLDRLSIVLCESEAATTGTAGPAPGYETLRYPTN